MSHKYTPMFHLFIDKKHWEGRPFSVDSAYTNPRYFDTEAEAWVWVKEILERVSRGEGNELWQEEITRYEETTNE